MKNIFIVLCVLSTMVMLSCRKKYDEVTVPYNGNGYGNYTYTTQTDYYDKDGSFSETRINTGTLYITNPSSSYTISVIPLYGWTYSLDLVYWNNMSGTFQIATQDVYVNNKTVRVSPTKQGEINIDGSLDYGYESFDYSTSMKTINTVHAVMK